MSHPHADPPHGHFEHAYQGTPPWDIGRPQSAIMMLEETDAIGEAVLDAGCGTGENALYLAERGHDVWGIDGAPTAITRARQKAQERGIEAHFEVADALHLEALGRTFNTVIDVGLFHSFDDGARVLWTRSLAGVLRPAGRYFAVTFSDKVPFEGGPRRIRREEFGQTFSEGFCVVSVEETVLDSSRGPSVVPAWLATIERTT